MFKIKNARAGLSMLIMMAICIGFAFALPSCKEEGGEILAPFDTPSNTSVEEVPVGKNKGGESFQASPYVSKIIPNVPHYYEWNATENPSHYNWCAHAALKCVLAYHGVSQTLGQLHSIFWDNAQAYRLNGGRCGDYKYCASLYDLEMACQFDLGLPNSSMETVSTISAFWQKLKDGVTYNKPVIVPSYYLESYGHNYVVVGFQEGANNTERKLYLRDVKLSSPSNLACDRECNLQTFWSYRNGNQVFVVRP